MPVEEEGNASESKTEPDSKGTPAGELQSGSSVDISSSLLDMYDTLAVKTRTKEEEAKSTKENITSSQNHMSVTNNSFKRSYTHPKPTSLRDKKRPLSTSSESSSSSSSSSSLPRNGLDVKKSYLASIESLEDEEEVTSPSREGLQRLHPFHRHSAASLSEDGADTDNQGDNSPSAAALQRPRYCDPSLSYTDRVLMEIVDTERTYVRDLNEIIQGYKKPLSEDENGRISNENLKDLFSNIEDIYTFNSTFLQELEQCGLDPVAVARCFVMNNTGFSVYTQFCTNYPRIVSVLTDLMRNNETADIFKVHQMALHHSLPLGSYLLKPVQRILKYHLLLQNIVKHFDKENDAYPDIKNALSVMTGIAYSINAMKRKYEHAVRVQEIQSLLYGWEGQDLTTYGELVAEGSFRMVGAKAFRHIFLFEKMLLVAKKKEEGILSYKTHIMCSNLMLIESIQGEPFCFQVVPFNNPCFQYTFQARNLEQKREWCLQLKRVIIESYNAVIPYHAKQLVLELGQSRTDEQAACEKSSGKRLLQAPEYLKKRRQDRRKSDISLQKAFKLKRGYKKSPSQDQCSCTHQCSVMVNCDEGRRASVDVACSSASGSQNQRSCSCQRHISPSPTSPCKDECSGNSRTSTPTSNSISEKHTRHSKPNRRAWDPVTEDTSDTENEDNSYRINIHRLLRYRPPVTSRSRSCEEDPSGEYVTFIFANSHATRDAASPLNYSQSYDDTHEEPVLDRSSSRNSCPEVELTTENNKDDCSSKSANYDNLLNLWTRLGTVQVPQSATCPEQLSSSKKTTVRRAQSFTEMARLKVSSFQHTFLKRPHSRPATLDLSGSALEDASPTVPAVWLNKQQEHLPNTCKKCGSLPRSFQLGNESTDCEYEITKDSATKTSKLRMRAEHMRSQHSDQRPHTIASDKPSQVDFMDDFERYIEDTSCKNNSYRFPVNREEFEEPETTTGCTTTPAISMENVSIHPEHKIYRQEGYRHPSWKNVFSSFGSKLAHFRSSLSPSHTEHTDSCSTISVDSESHHAGPFRERSLSRSSVHSDKDGGSRIMHSKFVTSLTRAYSSVLKPRMRRENSQKSLESSSPLVRRVVLPVYRQGGSAIGARMASPLESEYCLLPAPPLIKDNELRPDSVLSESSNTASSSDSGKPHKINASPLTPASDLYIKNEDCPSDHSDGSADSYYERTFEAIENEFPGEIFRDSAIYSDPEEADLSASELHASKGNYKDVNCEKENNENVITFMCVKKKVQGAIIDRLKVLEENTKFRNELAKPSVEGIKSIQQRRLELEKWCNTEREDDDVEQLTEAVNTELNSTTQETGEVKPQNRMKGWVKHVVDKFQSDSSV